MTRDNRPHTRIRHYCADEPAASPVSARSGRARIARIACVTPLGARGLADHRTLQAGLHAAGNSADLRALSAAMRRAPKESRKA